MGPETDRFSGSAFGQGHCVASPMSLDGATYAHAYGDASVSSGGVVSVGAGGGATDSDGAFSGGGGGGDVFGSGSDSAGGGGGGGSEAMDAFSCYESLQSVMSSLCQENMTPSSSAAAAAAAASLSVAMPETYTIHGTYMLQRDPKVDCFKEPPVTPLPPLSASHAGMHGFFQQADYPTFADDPCLKQPGAATFGDSPDYYHHHHHSHHLQQPPHKQYQSGFAVPSYHHQAKGEFDPHAASSFADSRRAYHAGYASADYAYDDGRGGGGGGGMTPNTTEAGFGFATTSAYRGGDINVQLGRQPAYSHRPPLSLNIGGSRMSPTRWAEDGRREGTATREGAGRDGHAGRGGQGRPRGKGELPG